MAAAGGVLGDIIAGHTTCNDRQVYIIIFIGIRTQGLCVELDRVE